jgi:hypothetical protein
MELFILLYIGKREIYVMNNKHNITSIDLDIISAVDIIDVKDCN